MSAHGRGVMVGNRSPIPMSLVQILLALFLPPLAVFLKKGANADFVINLLLWIFLLHIGGVIHAFWVLTRKEA